MEIIDIISKCCGSMIKTTSPEQNHIIQTCMKCGQKTERKAVKITITPAISKKKKGKK